MGTGTGTTSTLWALGYTSSIIGLHLCTLQSTLLGYGGIWVLQNASSRNAFAGRFVLVPRDTVISEWKLS